MSNTWKGDTLGQNVIATHIQNIQNRHTTKAAISHTFSFQLFLRLSAQNYGKQDIVPHSINSLGQYIGDIRSGAPLPPGAAGFQKQHNTLWVPMCKQHPWCE